MSVTTPAPDEEAQDPASRGRRAVTVLLVVVVCAAQVVVLLATFAMGLVWGGVTYIAALLQAAAALVLVAWLAGRRRGLLLLLPVLSAALSAGLFGAGYAYDRATGCNDRERTAVEALAAPPGTTVEFAGEYVEGCVARTTMDLTDEEIVEHYEAELARLGWTETPGELEARVGTAAVKGGVQLTVQIEDAAMEGDGGQMLETVVGGPTTSAPCVVNRVGNDEAMSREVTDQVEPGQWMMFASSDDLPASVVVRDASGEVVFDQEAHPRPSDNDELMGFQDALPDVDMTLVLDEGRHEVECRPGDGEVTVVPLHVAWGPDGPGTTKSVVLRVYELRDLG